MKITYTSTETEYPEVYDSLAALEAELRLDAEDDYTENVIGQIKAGATVVRVANGSDWDTYTVTEDS